MTKRRVIGLDFDDVLMDFNGALCDYHNLEYGGSLTPAQYTDFDLRNIWHCSKEEADQRILDFYQSDLHHSASPMRNGQEAVKKLSENNDLVVVTSRPEHVRELSLNWLIKHYPDLVEKAHFTNLFANRGGVRKPKSQVCAELGVDVFVDDFIGNANDVAESGREVLLFDAPWNQQKQLHQKITRVRDWEHILEVLGEK